MYTEIQFTAIFIPVFYPKVWTAATLPSISQWHYCLIQFVQSLCFLECVWKWAICYKGKTHIENENFLLRTGYEL